VRGRSTVLVVALLVACTTDDDVREGLSTSRGGGASASQTEGDDDGFGDEGDDSAGGRPSTGDDGDGGDTGPVGEDDGGPTGGACDLGMTAAIRLSLDVSWGGGLAVVAGAGEIDIWLLAELEQAGTSVGLTGSVCRIELPDFQTGVLAGNETYGTVFPDSIWTQAGMPTIDAMATISSADPGATIAVERGAVVLGATLADPLDGAWPRSWSELQTVDHDGDGHPGITANAKTGGGYSYPRLEALNANARAEAIYIASRTMMELDGVIDSCDTASGSADVVMQNHAVGCRQVGGSPCSSNQTDMLSSNMPQFQTHGGVFDLVRLPSGSGCAAVLSTLP
jgi:hypothetical protein